ncbi:hypothetical protein V7S57_04000 [Caulobacter sp. CCNWLY153]|uniref:hypothetical protein n=1 Tax=unclassified Caulobacter TaxID=2648921 RepID=UPI002FF3981B
MGQRRKTGDGTRLPVVSRRTVVGATVIPLMGPARGAAPVRTASIPARCASWLALDQEIDRLGRRASALETSMIAQYPYFTLTERQISALPEGREMDAISAECDRLYEVRDKALVALSKLKPRTVQDATAMLSIGFRLNYCQDGEAWPFVREAQAFLTKAHCPDCGAAYAPVEPLPV